MKKSAYLFPGQGSQYVGMGKSFYQQSLLARRRFEEASDLLGMDLKKLCFDGPPADLKQTMNAQPAIVTVSVIAYELNCQKFGDKPDYLAGHSLGEYSALICGKAVSFADGIRLVRRRGLLMQQAVPDGKGVMAAVMGLEERDLAKICENISSPARPVVIACSNTAKQQVISGHQVSVRQVLEQLEHLSVRSRPLQVSGSFHSPMMEEAAYQFAEHLKAYTFQFPEIPVISNVSALPHERDSLIGSMIAQMTSTVRWFATIQYLKEDGVTHMIEMGPGKQLTNMLKNFSFSGVSHSLEDMKDLSELTDSLRSDMAIFLKNSKEKLERCLNAALISKNRNENTEEFSRGVIYPCKQLKMLLEQVVEDLTVEQMEAAKKWIDSILHTKKVPQEERERIIQLFYSQIGRLDDCLPVSLRH